MLEMGEVFRCGSIANIINNDIKKNKTKLLQIFDDVIQENKNKIIKIDKIDYNINDSEVIESQNESDFDIDLKSGQQIKKKIKNNDSKEKTERTLFVGNLPKNVKIKVFFFHFLILFELF
jgi:hypothetical protein